MNPQWTQVRLTPAIHAAWVGVGRPNDFRAIINGIDTAVRVGVSGPMVQQYRIGVGDSSSDLAVFNSMVQSGDASMQAGDFAGAVVFYQGAGQFGAVTLGPEIDTETNGASKFLTGDAWSVNTNLAAIPTTGATQSDAQNAQGFVRQMGNDYTQAVAITPAPSGGGGGGGSPTQPSSTLVSLAQSVVNYFQSNPCSQSAVSAVTQFQQQYNQEGSVNLTVDGKYGPYTQQALQNVLNASGGGSAPANCFPGGGGPTRPPSPTPTPGGGPGGSNVNILNTQGLPAWVPWAIGLVAVAAGVGLLAYARREPGHTPATVPGHSVHPLPPRRHVVHRLARRPVRRAARRRTIRRRR